MVDFSILSPNLRSQDIDEDFLSSLPEDLAGELKSSTKKNQKAEDDVGRLFKADTQIDYDSKTLNELYEKTNRSRTQEKHDMLKWMLGCFRGVKMVFRNAVIENSSKIKL